MVAKKIGGGKLTRSETVTVRLDPKLRYLAELAARKHRRTLSSYIEWAIEESLGNIVLADEGEKYEQTILNRASDLWDVDEADRFVALAFCFPELLTHEEQVLWKLVRENGSLWRGKYNPEWTWRIDEQSIMYERLRENWDNFVSVANGEADKNILPSWTKERVFNPDDEIPF